MEIEVFAMIVQAINNTINKFRNLRKHMLRDYGG